MEGEMRILLMIFCLLLAFHGIARANPKEIFVKHCGACHKTKGKVEPVNPADKAGIVWLKYFKRKRHKPDLSFIPEKEMKIIKQYLVEHAADSDQPEAAIIPK